MLYEESIPDSRQEVRALHTIMGTLNRREQREHPACRLGTGRVVVMFCTGQIVLRCQVKCPPSMHPLACLFALALA